MFEKKDMRGWEKQIKPRQHRKIGSCTIKESQIPIKKTALISTLIHTGMTSSLPAQKGDGNDNPHTKPDRPYPLPQIPL